MKKTLLVALAASLLVVGAPALAEDGETATPDIASLTWLAGTRHIVRDDGTIAYEEPQDTALAKVEKLVEG